VSKIVVEQWDSLSNQINQQIDLIYYPYAERHGSAGNLSIRADSNEDVWHKFIDEELSDARRVTLEHFHLFEWFPLSPGRFHLSESKEIRKRARDNLVEKDGEVFYDPYGKSQIIQAGVGAVRLLPKKIGQKDYYFMTVSSTDTCHEGFPVLIPRRFYAPLKQRMLAEGAVPVTVSGEMSYIDKDTLPRPFFNSSNWLSRTLPLLYLHVDHIEQLKHPRQGVSSYHVSAAASFAGEFEGKKGLYPTYATFDPAKRESLNEAYDWMENFYAKGQYQGTVITDFEEDKFKSKFPQQAVFNLPQLMKGQLDFNEAKDFLRDIGLTKFIRHNSAKSIRIFIINRIRGDQINVGPIKNSNAVAIGREARATTKQN
jgi:hypothetical protein